MICNKCNLDKNIDCFYKHSSIKGGGLRKVCTECNTKYRLTKRKENPEKDKQNQKVWVSNNRQYVNNNWKNYRLLNKDKWKSVHLKRNFNMSLTEFQKILTDQNHLCAICKNPESIIDKRNNVKRSLSVDHDHNTGKIRGLLCTNCNQGIGKLKDDPNILREAANYIELFRKF